MLDGLKTEHLNFRPFAGSKGSYRGWNVVSEIRRLF